MIRYKDVMKKLEDHLKDITLEQLNKELEEAGMNFYAIEKQPDIPPSALNDGLSCKHLRADESCNYSDNGCEAWLDWHLDQREEEPIEHFCRLPKSERGKYSE